MKRIDYVIETLAPVIFAEKSNDSVLYATKNYFPGSAVRGALAQEYISANKLKDAHKDENFYNLFLSGKVRFLPAYPIGEAENDNLEPFVIPLSIMRSKDGKSVVDISGGQNFFSGYKKMQGFAVRDKSAVVMNLDKIGVNVKIEFHMSRNSASERIIGSSKDGNVFNYEYIQPWQYFKGSLLADDDCADTLEQILKRLNIKYLYFGRSKNVQYGKCSVKFKTVPQEFVKPVQTEHLYLYALTPYIPYGEWNRVSSVADELFDTIEDRLNKKGIVININRKQIRLYTATEDIDGFVNVWQLKKSREKSISAGSLIELKYTSDKDLTAEISELLLQGFGKGCEDGFGQFRLWTAQEKIAASVVADVVEKSNVEYLIQDRCRKIVQNLILNELKRQSAEDIKSGGLKLNKNSNHILKRIEYLMYSTKTKMQIQYEIKNELKAAAKDNLTKIKLNWISLFDLLTENNGAEPFYADIKWSEKLGVSEKYADELKKVIGADIFQLDEDMAYKTYWMWFCRHAVKADKEV